MFAAWINGLLSQADPRSYPELSSLIGDDRKAERGPVQSDAAEAAQNLRMWGVWLKAVNRSSGTTTPEDEGVEAP